MLLIQTKNKIVAVRDPLKRLYSAWHDKSRTFRFQNGSIDWDLAEQTTTWTEGTANDKEARAVMKDVLSRHDINFNAKNFGMEKFEEMIEFNITYVT